MLWLLVDAACLSREAALIAELERLLDEVEATAAGPATALLSLDPESLQNRVNAALHRAADSTQRLVLGRVEPGKSEALVGRDLRRQSLAGRDLSGALLLAADLRDCDLRGVNLLGADLRDARLQGADLRDAFFVTQGQLNAALGDGATQLPAHLRRPWGWAGA